MTKPNKDIEIKKVRTRVGNKTVFFSAEICKFPESCLSKDLYKESFKEVDELVRESWGKFEKEYIEMSIFHSYYLCLLRDGEGKLVGVAPLKKVKLSKGEVYSFGLTAIHPDYRGIGLLKKMGTILGKKVIIENLMRGKFSVEIIFITPNIRTLGTLARVSKFIYPNPYEVNSRNEIKKADEVTWARINEYLKVSGENFRKLDRVGCIMEGFYDSRPDLEVKRKIEHADKYLDNFGEKYLYSGHGKEVVARSIVDLRGLMVR